MPAFHAYIRVEVTSGWRIVVTELLVEKLRRPTDQLMRLTDIMQQLSSTYLAQRTIAFGENVADNFKHCVTKNGGKCLHH